ncbi:MAG TPA: ABC transporter permease [Balneolaceae bacterium]|nr:ABC transporter permease [Balneolaceae bacterium]
MLKNYFKTALRNFRRHKGSFFINVIGLAIGMACSILILLWVGNELSVNTFHKKLDRIYSVMEYQYYADGVNAIPNTPGILAPALKDEIPEIDQAATITWNMDNLFTVGDKSFKESGIYAGDEFFNIFSFHLISGMPEHVLEKPESVVLSQSLAEKYFGSPEKAIGKAIVINQDKSYTVTGVFKDVPKTSTLQFDYVFPFKDWLASNQWAKHWGNNGPMTYVTLKSGATKKEVNPKILDFIKKRVEGTKTELFLYPFKDVYLYSRFENKKPVGGRIEYVRLFLVVAFFILLIACINFMNLSTARSVKRAKEVGIRKAIGASRGSLIGQFLGESVLISFCALLLAVLLVEAFLPAFNNLTDKAIAIDFTDLRIWAGLLGITLFTGLISGSYPALYLSSFEAAKTLKATVKSSTVERFIRKGLVVFQFALSVILIISTILIYNQIQYVQHKNLGYKINNLVKINIDGNLGDQWDTFRQELERNPNIVSVSRSSSSFLSRNSNTGDVSWPGKDPSTEILFEMVRSDYGLMHTMGMQVAQGRSFSRDYGLDTTRVIINQKAAQVMGMQKPVGKILDFWDKKWEIVGVAKDFHFEQLHHEIAPLIFMLAPQDTWVGFVRVKSAGISSTLADIKKMYKQINPNYPFDYQFMDQAYAKLYRSEMRVGELARYAALLAVIICCLGLFGLSAFTAEQRTKEIGIRKVLGASVQNLILMLSKDFTKPVLIAIGIAIPVSWYLMHNWLSNYAYHVDISWWVFALAGGLALVIAWLTVSWQSVKAAISNPVNSLKSE